MRNLIQIVSLYLLRSLFLEQPQIGPYSNVSATRLTQIIARLGFGDCKSRDSSGSKRGFKINFAKVCSTLSRNNNWDAQEITKRVSEVSDCQFSDDKIKQILSDTSLTLNKEVSDVSDNLTDKPLISETTCFEDLQGILLDKPGYEAVALDLVMLGFKEEQLESWKVEGLIYEPRSGVLRLL